MAKVSVREAARRLGVGVARVHQRIADGSLPAERIGSQWAVDEASLEGVLESGVPGRPLSARSAWALIVLSQDPEDPLSELAAAEQARARRRLGRLLLSARAAQPTEANVHEQAALLRSWLRNRAARRLYRASPIDLPDLRVDERVVLSGLSHPQSSIASADVVEGYVRAGDLDALVQDYLLSPAAPGVAAPAILHVMPPEPPDDLRDIPLLLLAADLAEHRGPREEARAVELLRELADRNPGLVASGEDA